jgi:hypothetical protein
MTGTHGVSRTLHIRQVQVVTLDDPRSVLDDLFCGQLPEFEESPNDRVTYAEQFGGLLQRQPVPVLLKVGKPVMVANLSYSGSDPGFALPSAIPQAIEHRGDRRVVAHLREFRDQLASALVRRTTVLAPAITTRVAEARRHC